MLPKLDKPGIMASLPRRDFIKVEPTELSPPMIQTAALPTSITRAFVRLFVWLYFGGLVFAGLFFDRLRGKNSVERQAIRLRQTAERFGGTFRKIGRLLAMRIDLLPWAYCVELSKIGNQMAAFPLKQAITKIEAATGKPLAETFAQFDPEPIVTSTEACIYQALLHNGSKVVVKVQRPEIGKLFMADLKALDWILVFCESISILRPESTKKLRRELRDTIQDELNFLLEARHQALFRREAKKSGKKFFTAPRIYFKYCSKEVIVEEFTSGMWLWELLAAVEQNDQDALARAKQLNIDPELVAKRLLWVNFWGIDEHLHFRSDLHPDNVIIRKNSKLTFIDYSSIGWLGQEKRIAVRQLMVAAWNRDPQEMAQEAMVLLEPLPPIDTTKFSRDLEAAFWKFLYGLESKHIEWWERTSARLWIGFVRVAREHKLSMSIHVLRLMRSNLFYDTIAARLSPGIDRIKEYHKFSNYYAGAARKRMEKRLREQFEDGINNRIYLQVEDITNTSQRIFRQLQRLLSRPVIKISAVLGKSVYSLAVLFRLLGLVAAITFLGVAFIVGIQWVTSGQFMPLMDALIQAVSNRFYQLAVAVLVLISFRNMLLRMSDKEV